MAEIDIRRLTGGNVRNLSGHERGLEARRLFNLDQMDRGAEKVTVVIPKEVYAITTSFFQGMFSASVAHFGSPEAFFRHYQFDASAAILRQIDRGMNAIMTRRHSMAAA